MLITYIIRLIIFFLLITEVFSQTQLRNNFDILDSLAKEQSEVISRQIQEKGINKAQIKFSEHPARRLIKQNLFDELKKNKFDLVIVDLNVPYLESSRIIPRLKKTGRGLPVALAVGDEKWRSSQALRKLGVDLVISRPLEMDRTLGLISQALSMRK